LKIFFNFDIFDNFDLESHPGSQPLKYNFVYNHICNPFTGAQSKFNKFVNNPIKLQGMTIFELRNLHNETPSKKQKIIFQ
jgi:hypothetical protein